jgi:hypothetical protein
MTIHHFTLPQDEPGVGHAMDFEQIKTQGLGLVLGLGPVFLHACPRQRVCENLFAELLQSRVGATRIFF